MVTALESTEKHSHLYRWTQSRGQVMDLNIETTIVILL